MVIFKRPIIPKWHCSPSWAKYLACDECGRWNFFSEKPIINHSEGIWEPNNEHVKVHCILEPVIEIDDNIDWQNSLLEHPLISSSDKQTTAFINLNVNDIVVLDSCQLGVIVEIENDEIRIRCLSMIVYSRHKYTYAEDDSYYTFNNRLGGWHQYSDGVYSGALAEDNICVIRGLTIIDILKPHEIEIT